jgi:RNA polymerase primary sigma factor
MATDVLNKSRKPAASAGRSTPARGSAGEPPRRNVRRGAPPVISPRRPRPGRVTAPGRPVAARPAAATDGPVDGEPGLGGEGAENLALLEAAVTAPGGDDEVVAPDLDAGVDPDAVASAVRPARVRRDDPANSLAKYFRDMAALDVLKPEEEFKAARDIEELEIALWERVFAHAPVVDHVVKVVEACMDNSIAEFRALRRAAAEPRGTAARPDRKLARVARKAAERVRVLDVDKQYLDAVLAELDKITRNIPTRVVAGKLAFSTKNAGWRGYLRGIHSASRGAADARNAFVKANLRLVVSIARRFNHGRMALADLIQEGNIGLMKAVERYDYRRGFRFSTYASWWIRHAISRALADKGREVRLPVHMIDAYHRIAKATRELTAKLGRQPTSEEIAAAANIPPGKIEKMRTYLVDQSFSLDRPLNDEDGRHFVEFLQDPEEDDSPVEDLVSQAMTDEVRHLLHNLNPIEADILRKRFGLDDDRELTLKEIGEEYNLSRERIRQLQEQALGKMRRAMQRKDMM